MKVMNMVCTSHMRKEIQTSVNVIISRPPCPAGLNLTFRTPHPGALLSGLVQSQLSSYNQPLALSILRVEGGRVLSVWYTFIGFQLRTSQTATMPSCEATANFDPQAENAVENDAGTALDD